jgi:signal peptidase I
MRPALEPGDWLLTDPSVRTWPRRGSIVVVREPGSELLAIKRIAARPGDVVRTRSGPIRLSASQAWLLGDDRERSIDSRTYGPVELERLVARAWFRYGPKTRIGRLSTDQPSRLAALDATAASSAPPGVALGAPGRGSGERSDLSSGHD